ncbi:MAG: hypothetical protein ACMXYB_03050 [Candidatus Woesearchaeota archaeon]
MEVFKLINKKSSQGIGTLIIFIALILVAAVAAGVIIQTGNELQSKSLAIAAQTQAQLVTFVRIDSVYVFDTSNAQVTGGVDNISANIRVGTQIEDIKLEDLTIQLFTRHGSQILTFSGDGNYSEEEFGITYLTNGGEPVMNGYITGRDVVTVEFTTKFNMTERDQGSLRFTPRDGLSLGVEFYLPGAMTGRVTKLYP